VITRSRPLLGTIVAIRADAEGVAVDAAFAAVERVHGLMSFHAPQSDVARINRNAHRAAVPVDRWTFAVLEQALELSVRSDGAFDVFVPGSGACYRDLVLTAAGRVRLRRPAAVDLGGIAKGFAVDMAVQALLENGAASGSVNAGGDLRMFGRCRGPLRIRVPGAASHCVVVPAATHVAFATSSSYFGTRINDVRRSQRERLDWSITVGAHSCMVADGLTKAVALLGPLVDLLRRFDATAYAVDRRGQLYAARA
jgi:thiamine biosynthesis lipoprotein